MPIKFQANLNTMIMGPSGVGKTHFILDVIKRQLIHPMPLRIFYMYNIEQDFMRTWNEQEKQHITFIKGMEFDKLDTSEPSMLVIDDFVLTSNKEVGKLFLMGSHHRKISLFYISQSIFPDCPIFRKMSRNAHYYVIFHSLRNTVQVQTLAQQMGLAKPVKSAYIKAGETDRGLIVISIPPGQKQDLAVISDWWSPWPSIYH